MKRKSYLLLSKLIVELLLLLNIIKANYREATLKSYKLISE